MEMGGAGQAPPRGYSGSARYRFALAAVALLVAISVILALLYLPTSPFRERYVSYDYSVTVDSSGVFVVVCPLPADYFGAVCPDVVPSVLVQGDVSVSVVTTPYGEGMEVEGTGPAVITWTYSYTYRWSTQSYADHYSNLSMLGSGYYDVGGLDAFVFSQGPDVSLGLSYQYDHTYGNVGADFLKYEASSGLVAGWNSLQVDLDWIMA